jgi:hypothetical protein
MVVIMRLIEAIKKSGSSRAHSSSDDQEFVGDIDRLRHECKVGTETRLWAGYLPVTALPLSSYGLDC